jgi:hypothetical protein
MEEQDKIYTPIRIKEERESLMKGYLVTSIGFGVFAIAYYYLTTNLENGTGPKRINWLAYIVYESLGRIYGTILLASISGILLSIFIYKLLVLQKKINNQVR